MFDLKKAWEKATTDQKHELVRGLFPNGLQYSSERAYFIMEGTPLYSSVYAGLERAAAEFPAESNFGVPNQPRLNCQEEELDIKFQPDFKNLHRVLLRH